MNTTTATAEPPMAEVAEPPMAKVNTAEQDLLDLGITAQSFLAKALDGAEDTNEEEDADSEAVFFSKFVLYNDTFMEALQDPGKPSIKGKLSKNLKMVPVII